MSGEVIDLYEDGDVVCVKPRDRIGGDRWKDYVKANRRGGVVWDRKRGGCQNIVSVSGVPVIVASYVESGFVPVATDSLAKKLRDVTVDMAGDDIKAEMENGFCQTDAQRETPEEIRSRVESDFRKISKRLNKRGLQLDIHQDTGVKFLKARNKAFLWDDMGLGKTVQALCAIPEENPPVIVVCPPNVKGVWVRESAFWRPEYTVKTPAFASRDKDKKEIGSTKKQQFAWPQEGEMVVISYQQLPLIESLWGDDYGTHRSSEKPKYWDKAVSPVMKAPRGTVLIGDEIHRVAGKGSGKQMSAQAVNFTSLAWAVRKCGGYTWGLTGTPLPANPLQLWRQLTRFGLARDSIGNFNTFMLYFGGEKGQYGIEWSSYGPPDEYVQDLVDSLRKVALRRVKEDVLKNLPPLKKTDTFVKLDKSDKEVKEYLDRMNEFIEKHLGNKKPINEMTPQELFGRMPGFEDFSRMRSLIAGTKVKATIEYVKDHLDIEGIYREVAKLYSTPDKIAYEVNERLEERRILLFTANVMPATTTMEELNSHIKRMNTVYKLKIPFWSKINTEVTSDEKTARVRRFQNKLNDPKGSLLGLSIGIRAGGEGLTLTRATHGAIIDVEWNPGQMDQALARFHGRNDKITKDNIAAGREYTVRYFLIDHPLEERMHQILSEKAETIRNSVDAMVSQPDADIDYVPPWAYEAEGESGEEPLVASLEGLMTTTEYVEEKDALESERSKEVADKVLRGETEDLEESDFESVQKQWVKDNLRWVTLWHNNTGFWVDEDRYSSYAGRYIRTKGYFYDLFKSGDIDGRGYPNTKRWSWFLTELNKTKSSKKHLSVPWEIIGKREVPRSARTDLEKEAYRIAPDFIENRFIRPDWQHFYDSMRTGLNSLEKYTRDMPDSSSALNGLRAFELRDAVMSGKGLTNHQFAYLEEVIYGKKITKAIRQEESELDDFHMPANALEDWLMQWAITMQGRDLDKATVQNKWGWRKSHSPDGHAFANAFHAELGLTDKFYKKLESMLKVYGGKKTDHGEGAQVPDFHSRPKASDPFESDFKIDEGSSAPKEVKPRKKKTVTKTEITKPFDKKQVLSAFSFPSRDLADGFRDVAVSDHSDVISVTKPDEDNDMDLLVRGEEAMAKYRNIAKEYGGEEIKDEWPEERPHDPEASVKESERLIFMSKLMKKSFNQLDAWRWTKLLKVGDEVSVNWTGSGNQYSVKRGKIVKILKNVMRVELLDFYGVPYSNYKVGSTVDVPYGRLDSSRNMTWQNGVFPVGWRSEEEEAKIEATHASLDKALAESKAKKSSVVDEEWARAAEKNKKDAEKNHKMIEGLVGNVFLHSSGAGMNDYYSILVGVDPLEKKSYGWHVSGKLRIIGDPTESIYSDGDFDALTLPVYKYGERKGIGVYIMTPEQLKEKLRFHIERGTIPDKIKQLMGIWEEPQRDDGKTFSVGDVVRSVDDSEPMSYLVLDEVDADGYQPIYPLKDPGMEDWDRNHVELADEEKNLRLVKKSPGDYTFYGAGAGDLWDSFVSFIGKSFLVDPERSDKALSFWRKHDKDGYSRIGIDEDSNDFYGRKRPVKKVQEPQEELVYYYTTAEEDYDGFGTKTVESDVGLDSRGRPFRKVGIKPKSEKWQVQRYWSGNHRPLSEEEFSEQVSMGLIKPIVDPEEDETEKRFKAIVSMSGMGKRVNTADIERALEEAQEIGLLDQFAEWARSQSFVSGFFERFESVFNEFLEEEGDSEEVRVSSESVESLDPINHPIWLYDEILDYYLRHLADSKDSVRSAAFAGIDIPREPGSFYGLMDEHKEKARSFLASGLKSVRIEKHIDSQPLLAPRYDEKFLDDVVKVAWYWPDKPEDMIGEELPAEIIDELPVEEAEFFKAEKEIPVFRPLIADDFLDEMFQKAWDDILEDTGAVERDYYEETTQRLKPKIVQIFSQMFMKVNVSTALRWLEDVQPNVMSVFSLRKHWVEELSPLDLGESEAIESSLKMIEKVHRVDNDLCADFDSQKCQNWRVVRSYLGELYEDLSYGDIGEIKSVPDEIKSEAEKEYQRIHTGQKRAWSNGFDLDVGQVYYLNDYHSEGAGYFFKIVEDFVRGGQDYARVLELRPKRSTEIVEKEYGPARFINMDGNFNEVDGFPDPKVPVVFTLKARWDGYEYKADYNWFKDYASGMRSPNSYKTASGALRRALKESSDLRSSLEEAGWELVIKKEVLGGPNDYKEKKESKKTVSTSKAPVKESPKPVESSRAEEFEKGLMGAVGGALDDLLGSL